MLLRYYMKEGKRVYTMKMNSPEGECTLNAHPARFSPDDKFSQQRVELKKRFGLLPTQCQQLIQLIMHQEEEISIDNFRLASFMKKDSETIYNDVENQNINAKYDFTYFSLVSFGICEYFIFYIFLFQQQDAQNIFNNLYFITRACSIFLILKFTKANQDSFQKIFTTYFTNLKQKKQLQYFVFCQIFIWLIICCCKNLILLNTFLLLVKSKLFYSFVFKILRGFPLKNHYYKFCLIFGIFLLFVFFKNETYSINILLLIVAGLLFVYQEEIIVVELENDEPLISVHVIQALFGLILLLKNILTLQIFQLPNMTFKELFMIILLLICNTIKYISYKKIKISKNNSSQSFYQVQIQLLIVSTIALILDFIFLHNQFGFLDFLINIIGFGSIIYFNKNLLLLLLNKNQNEKLETQLLKNKENNQQKFQVNLFQKINNNLINESFIKNFKDNT